MTLGPGAWVLVCPPATGTALRPLIELRSAEREVRVVERPAPPVDEEWPDLLPADAAGALLVGDRRRAPGTALGSPLAQDGAGGWVPVGWLPRAASVDDFVAAVRRVAGRRDRAPLALLGQRSPRYQRLTGRMVHHLGGTEVVRWSADRVTREDLVTGLGSGLGLAVYLGHGRPSGWAAYRGLRADHLRPVAAEPLGLLVSVTCWTASRKGTGTSFCEEVVLQGSAAAALGAVHRTLHLDNTRLVLAMAAALRRGAATAGDLILGMLLPDGGRPVPEAARLRLCGDPLASLAAAPGAAARARALPAPDPEFTPRVAS